MKRSITALAILALISPVLAQAQVIQKDWTRCDVELLKEIRGKAYRLTSRDAHIIKYLDLKGYRLRSRKNTDLAKNRDTAVCDNSVWNFVTVKKYGGKAAEDYGKAVNITEEIKVLLRVVETYNKIDKSVEAVYAEAKKVYAAAAGLKVITVQDDSVPLIAKVAERDRAGNESVDQILSLVRYGTGDTVKGVSGKVYGGSLVGDYYKAQLALRKVLDGVQKEYGFTYPLSVKDMAAQAEDEPIEVAALLKNSKYTAANADDGTAKILPGAEAPHDSIMNLIDWSQRNQLYRHSLYVSQIPGWVADMLPNKSVEVWKGQVAQKEKIASGKDATEKERIKMAALEKSIRGQVGREIGFDRLEEIWKEKSGDVSGAQADDMTVVNAEINKLRVKKDGEGGYLSVWRTTDEKGTVVDHEVPLVADADGKYKLDESVLGPIVNDINANEPFMAKLKALRAALGAKEVVSGPVDANLGVDESLVGSGKKGEKGEKKSSVDDKYAKCNSPGDIFRDRDGKILDNRMSEIESFTDQRDKNDVARPGLKNKLLECAEKFSKTSLAEKLEELEASFPAFSKSKKFKESLVKQQLAAVNKVESDFEAQRKACEGAVDAESTAVGITGSPAEEKKKIIELAVTALEKGYARGSRRVLAAIKELEASYLKEPSENSPSGRFNSLFEYTGDVWKSKENLRNGKGIQQYFDETFYVTDSSTLTACYEAFKVRPVNPTEVNNAYGDSEKWNKLMNSSRWDKRDPADVDILCGICSTTTKKSKTCKSEPRYRNGEGTIINYLRDGVPLKIKEEPAKKKVVKEEEPVKKEGPVKEPTPDERIKELKRRLGSTE